MPSAFNAQSRRPDFAEALWKCGTRGSGCIESPSAFLGWNNNVPGYPFDPNSDVVVRSTRQTNRQNDLIALGIAVRPILRGGASISSDLFSAANLVNNEVRSGEIAQAVVSGTTKTGAGASLAGVTVSVYLIQYTTTGALFKGDKFDVDVVSDGSGLWSMNLAPGYYQFDGYIVGSPDRAGTTKKTVGSPSTNVDIFMRDPTAADSGGSGGPGTFRVTPASPRRRT